MYTYNPTTVVKPCCHFIPLSNAGVKLHKFALNSTPIPYSNTNS